MYVECGIDSAVFISPLGALLLTLQKEWAQLTRNEIEMHAMRCIAHNDVKIDLTSKHLMFLMMWRKVEVGNCWHFLCDIVVKHPLSHSYRSRCHFNLNRLQFSLKSSLATVNGHRTFPWQASLNKLQIKNFGSVRFGFFTHSVFVSWKRNPCPKNMHKK